MSKKKLIRISTVLAAATMALSMQTALGAYAAMPENNVLSTGEENVDAPIGEITWNGIVYDLYEGNEAHVKDGSAASGTVQIPDAVYEGNTYYIVTKIEENAFDSNANITAVDMQYASGLKEIGKFAFNYCKNLETVALPFNLKIDMFFSTIFDKCVSLRAFMPTYGKNYSIIDGVVYNEDQTKILKYPIAKPGDSLNVIDGVTVGFGAFTGVKNIHNINVPIEIDESNVAYVIEKYGDFIRPIATDNVSINNISIFTYSDDDSEEPQISPLFRDVVYDQLGIFSGPSKYYAKRYADYVVKKYVDMENDSDLVKALKLHNWLCNHVKYDPVVAASLAKGINSSGTKNSFYSSAFLHYEKADYAYPEDGYYTICEGYSKAYKLLLDAAGVYSECVRGTGEKVFNHEWNIIRTNAYDNDPTNDRCYYIDTTWDDLDTGWYYKYFMCSDDKNDFGHSKYTKWNLDYFTPESLLQTLPEKTYSLKNIGDINGDNNVTYADLALIQNYTDSSLSDDQKANADVNFDGVIDEKDVEIVSGYIYKKLGDLTENGIVDEDDYKTLEFYLTYNINMFDYMIAAADANMDGNIDEADLETIKSMYGQNRETKDFYEYYIEKIQQNFPDELKSNKD